MTMALCFHCGSTKFGAICPCPQCEVNSTGNMHLDITFSDHHLSVSTLEAFGEVIRALRTACEDDELRFWSFIRYVSVHHPDILGVKLDSNEQERCDALLARANVPPVRIEEPDRARFMREIEERGPKS